VKDNLDNIVTQIEKGEEISPFLFLGTNFELLNSHVNWLGIQVLEKFDVPKVNFLVLEDNGENIKIKDIKDFIKPAELGTPYKFQIFLIENISRMTLASFNSCLKFFEEPWVQNIIFLTNKSESWIIDTILSRVQIVNFWGNTQIPENNFYFSMLDSYLQTRSSEIFSYFFRNKLEKREYTDFLKNMILYSKKHWVFLDLLEEIDEDITLIETNNVNAKVVVDKYLLKI